MDPELIEFFLFIVFSGIFIYLYRRKHKRREKSYEEMIYEEVAFGGPTIFEFLPEVLIIMLTALAFVFIHDVRMNPDFWKAMGIGMLKLIFSKE